VKTYLITEDNTDAAILESILSALGLNEVVVVGAGAKAATMSLARSVAAARRLPVAVVMDADTTNDMLMQQEQEYFRGYMNVVIGPDRSQLFQAVPTLGEALFPSARDFEAIFGTRVPEADRKQFKRDRDAFLRQWALTDHDVSRINATKARKALEGSGLRGLVDFLTQEDRHLAAAQ
jgi:hypothetical protein